VLQGTHDNYEIDLFAPDRAIAELTGVEPTARRRRRIASSPIICAPRLPDRRRRAAVERGPRLCAAPDHAPRHAPRAVARRQRAADVTLVSALVREMGQAYPDWCAPRT
jgi:hypothetical protein